MLGILGGTSFRGSRALQQGDTVGVETEYGPCVTYRTEKAVFIARHGEDGLVPPHRVNHKAHLSAFKQLGVDRVLGFGSVGSLQPDLPPGTLVVPDDTFAPFRVVTFHDDAIRFTVPGLHKSWRGQVLTALRQAELNPVDGGVYVETLGPRFETPAEVRWLATTGDVVGMTCAAEAALANELDLPYCILSMIDNYANGLSVEPLTGKRFHELVAQNQEKVLKALEVLVACT